MAHPVYHNRGDVVVCVDPEGREQFLTKGKAYKVVGVHGLTDHVIIWGDDGLDHMCDPGRFIKQEPAAPADGRGE